MNSLKHGLVVVIPNKHELFDREGEDKEGGT